MENPIINKSFSSQPSSTSSFKPIKNNKSNLPVLGVTCLILSIISILFPSPTVAFISLIGSIIFIIKNKNNKITIGVLGILLSIIALIISFFNIKNEPIGSESISTDQMSTTVVDDQNETKIDAIKNTILNAINRETNQKTQEDYLSGYGWKMTEGAVLSLKDDKTFKWYETDKEDSSYYTGTYSVLSGNDAIEKIKQFTGGKFNDDRLASQSTLRQDIHYLELNINDLYSNGQKSDNTVNNKIRNYAVFFTKEDQDQATIVNLVSFEQFGILKIKQ